jgi:uncharacterized hydrophobic protein (TIGR00271 family)
VIHVRAVSPPDITPDALEALSRNTGVLNLVLFPAASRSPKGDAFQFDVITAEANQVLHLLRDLQIDRQGSIMLHTVETSISDAAARAEGREPPGKDFSPIWERVDATLRSMGTYPPSWFALLTIAGLIATVGIVTNSEILIVGAMVVGPEYGAIASIALGINKRDHRRIREGVRVLLIGFLIAILACLLFGLIINGFDLQDQAYSHGTRPVSDLINSPDFYSVVIAVLAGIVGIVSLAEARVGTLVGVFISITTIPAAADIGLSISFGFWNEAWGSFIQLLVNVVVLIVVGAVTLGLLRRFWNRRTAMARPRS